MIYRLDILFCRKLMVFNLICVLHTFYEIRGTIDSACINIFARHCVTLCLQNHQKVILYVLSLCFELYCIIVLKYYVIVCRLIMLYEED